MRIHRDAPFQVTRDAAVLQALVEPFQRDGSNQVRPLRFLAFDPATQDYVEGCLFQKQMLRTADFQVSRAADC